MKKKITGSVLSAGAIVLGLAAAGCGGAIENAADGWAMLGYTLLAIVLGCAALALAGLGLVVEQGVVNRLQQRNARPGENGTRPGGAVQTKIDVSHMSRKEMEEMEKRVMRGEVITL